MPKTAAELEALYGGYDDEDLEDETNDPMPEDPDEFRRQLARKINRYVADRKQYWRLCAQRECRRARQCRSRDLSCINFPPNPPVSDEEWAKILPKIERAVEQGMAERARERRERHERREREAAQSKLTTKREAASSRKIPNPISSPRRGNQCARRTP
jgi:hypothetical protein